MSEAAFSTTDLFRRRWFQAVWTVVLLLCGGLEVRRLISAMDSDSGVVAAFIYWDMETTLPFCLLLLLPILVRAGKGKKARKKVERQPSDRAGSLSSPMLLSRCLLIFSVSLAASWRVGAEPVDVPDELFGTTVAFADLPPAYHDEYSYLLQARTFLDGRCSYEPAAVRPDLFHQFHVLNERRTVSRYFPWTGCWIAAFEAFGQPLIGHWVAGGLAAVLFYLALLRIACPAAAMTGGMLIALSPGMAVFSNLLLAHHPTMLALSVFTYSFFRLMEAAESGSAPQQRNRSSTGWAFVAGTGLALAMLGRPMTAAGFALPYGIWLAVKLLRRAAPGKLMIGFAVPLACGFGILAYLSYEATGSWTRTAYQEYTERYTPRHRYGFQNAVRPSEVDAPPAIRAYDDWAQNLTAAVAAKNVGNRIVGSMQWALAIMPLLFLLLMCLPQLWRAPGLPDAICLQGKTGQDRRRSRSGLRLLAGSIVSLHVVHVPYWYDGIMHWHYVFESAPLLLLLAGVGFVVTIAELSRVLTRRMATAWVVAFTGAGLLPAWVALPVFDDTSKISAAVGELAFSKARFEYFNRTIADPAIRKPALILVDERGSDPQLSYIINPPTLDSEVLVCRDPSTAPELAELRAAFPDRTFYRFDPRILGFAPVAEPGDAETTSD